MAESLLDALEGSLRIFEKHRISLLGCSGSFSALQPGDAATGWSLSRRNGHGAPWHFAPRYRRREISHGQAAVPRPAQAWAVSTRPNRQNRSTCSRMRLVQKQKLRLVDRIKRAWRSQCPRHGGQDGRRHPGGKYEPSWFRCHLFPLMANKVARADCQDRTGGDVWAASHFAACPKNDGLAMPRYGKGLVTLLRAVRGGADAAERRPVRSRTRPTRTRWSRPCWRAHRRER